MKYILLPHGMSKKRVERLEGIRLTSKHYNRVLTKEDGAVIALSPSGGIVLGYFPNVIPVELCREVQPYLLALATQPVGGGNRGKAAGVPSELETLTNGQRGKRRRVPKLHELSPSDRNVLGFARNGVLGSFDRTADKPLCRTTEFGPEHRLVKPCLKFFKLLNAVYKIYSLGRYEAQLATVQKTHEAYRFPSTLFTTVTVNDNFQTASHRDGNDLPQGMGVMTCINSGEQSGGELIFPRYKLAVDYRTQDVLIADVHRELHGNAPLVGIPGEFHRLSCVLYFRENMSLCLSPEAEVEQAKRRKQGDKLYRKR